MKNILILCLLLTGCATPSLPKSVNLKPAGYHKYGQCALYAKNLEVDLLLNGLEARRIDYLWGNSNAHAVVIFKDLKGFWWLADNEKGAVSVKSDYDYLRIREIYPEITVFCSGVWSYLP